MSLFVRDPGRGVWRIAERIGPLQPWHAVLDPNVFEQLLTDTVHHSVRTLPGVGSRLASMGCGAVASVAVGGGARLVLDAGHELDEHHTVSIDVENVRSLIPALYGFGSNASSNDGFRTMLSTVTQASAATIASDEPSLASLLACIESATSAVGVGLLIETAGRHPQTISVGAPSGGWGVVDGTLARMLDTADLAKALPYELIARVARQLGFHGLTVHAGTVSGPTRRLSLIAGWTGKPPISRSQLDAIASIVAVSVEAIEARDTVVRTGLASASSQWAGMIHDGISQAVAAAVISINMLREGIVQDPDTAVSLLDESMDEIHRSMSDLRAVMMSAAGPAEANDRSLHATITDVIRRWRLPIRAIVRGDLNTSPAQISSVALAIIREAVLNASRHAGVDTVQVNVDNGPYGLKVVVRDEGRGMASLVDGIARQRLGIRLMHQRTASVGGSLTIESQPGRGTTVIARFPYGDGPSTPGTERS